MAIKTNITEAFRIANNALYFDDNSDYQTALYDICTILNPEIDEALIGTKYIEEY